MTPKTWAFKPSNNWKLFPWIRKKNKVKKEEEEEKEKQRNRTFIIPLTTRTFSEPRIDVLEWQKSVSDTRTFFALLSVNFSAGMSTVCWSISAKSKWSKISLRKTCFMLLTSKPLNQSLVLAQKKHCLDMTNLLMIRIPLKPWFFFQASSFQLLKLKIYCDDHSSLSNLLMVARLKS